MGNNYILGVLGMSGKTTRALLLMVIPGHLIFMFTVQAFSQGRLSITYSFALIFLAASFLQVSSSSSINNDHSYSIFVINRLHTVYLLTETARKSQQNHGTIHPKIIHFVSLHLFELFPQSAL